MFGQKKDKGQDAPTPVSDAEDAPVTGAQAGKGRPTPTRKEAEAKHRRPLVVNDRKAARAEQRKRNTEARAKMNEAMVTGDDRYMPHQHRGEQRRYIRDYVDARWSLGEFFLPLAFVFILLTFVFGNDAQVAVPMLLTLYLVVGLAILDSVLLGRRIRKRIVAKWGADQLQKGGVMYAAIRSFQMRPTRMPKPQVKRGQFPA